MVWLSPYPSDCGCRHTELLSSFTIGQQATTYALIDLYSREEYVEPLLNEVQGQHFNDFKTSGDGLPLLDSFLKESARVSAFESSKSNKGRDVSKISETQPAGVRRQALIPFTFSDGLRISTGDWVCVPHRSMMRDSQNFPNPLNFNGFRFVDSCPGGPDNATKPSKLTDTSEEWLVWGSGRILWYVLSVVHSIFCERLILTRKLTSNLEQPRKVLRDRGLEAYHRSYAPEI